MPTLDELQKLEDGPFHLLCDDLLRRLETRYRRLRTHGINPQGVSIKGQPDSYVGESANTCTIAFCYTVQRAGWWNKVVDDVKEAVAASPGVQEIVAAIPHNSDRDGPKDKTIDWLGAAKAAAGQATLRVVDGREIAGYLDRDQQDLRYEHLRIPYSRLSGQSILASCRRTNEQVIAGLTAGGRYDPDRYAPRDADRKLFGLWQGALRSDQKAGSLEREPTRLIALANDAGVGKTSLLASFVRSLGSVLPVLLVEARNLAFASEDSLVAHVVHALQGVLQPDARLMEEAAITHHLSAGTSLTVVLDGLDETKDAASVRKAITYWLRSRLGQESILVVSSRPEFWRLCVDRAWTRWMHADAPDDRTAATTTSRASVELVDPADGIRLPDRFSEPELEAAWVRAGRSPEQLLALPLEAREELRHPFTLRVYLDLWPVGSAPPGLTSRAELLEAWLNRRLDAEAVPEEWLTRRQYQDALRTVAARLAESDAGSLAVDDLTGVPRFDPARPPGVVVERLVAANVLESVPGHADRIRFAVEAVQDFYRAEAEVAAIVAAPLQSADDLAELTFTKAHTRLARIGQRIKDEPCRNEFVSRLAERDAAKAAVVLRAAPLAFESSVRKAVAAKLAQDTRSRYRIRGTLAVQLLGDIRCPESADSLLESLKQTPNCPPHIRATGALAFAKLGCAEGAGFTYTWPWFSRSTDAAYYFHDTLAVLRTASSEFKAALAEEAVRRLDSESGSSEHRRAVCVLGYLADDRLVQHLDHRLEKHGRLRQYENHALIAVGTETAAQVYARSARVVAQLIEEWRKIDRSGNDNLGLHFSIDPFSADIRDLMTPAFEAVIVSFVRDQQRELSYIGLGLAKHAKTPALVCELLAEGRFSDFGLAVNSGDLAEYVTPDAWLGWWNAVKDANARRSLLSVAGQLPSPSVEQVLIDFLDDAEPRIRAIAASQLGRMGSYRAVPFLRTLAADGSGQEDGWTQHSVLHALGRLRDPGSVDLLLRAARSGDAHAAFDAVYDLGAIGTPEAEAALFGLLSEQAVDARQVAGALVFHGSLTAVAKAIEIAKQQPEGPKWLDQALGLALSRRGHRVGEYYRHIHLRELIPFIASGEQCYKTEFEKWQFAHAFEQIDGKEVRELLYQWAARMGTPADSLARDDGVTIATIAYWELLNRGDDFAVPYYVREAISEDERRSWRARDLLRFSPPVVAKELWVHLALAASPTRVARILQVLGFFGSEEDVSVVKPYLDDPNDELADAAYEACCRMTDPMRVPRNWGGLR